MCGGVIIFDFVFNVIKVKGRKFMVEEFWLEFDVFVVDDFWGFYFIFKI